MRRIFQTALFIALAVLTARFSFTCFASTVTDITDQVSTTQISVGSNHKFIMTTADAVSDGQTITIAFPLAFTLSSETEDDVDVDDDGVDLTTAADCSGTEQMSVAISGQTLTMTVCAGDGGSIVSGSVVTIEIGTNASASGAGTQRITNPTTVGSWFVAVGGTSGISGSVLLTTSTNGGAGVSATVPAAEVPPERPPTDPGDHCSASHGDACTSSENSCGMTNSGFISCDGSCSASTPSDDECPATCSASEGDACTSSENSCGMTNSGTIGCSGSCSASSPDDGLCSTTSCSASEGNSCSSASNSCGMTNSGTIGCSGSCSASTPSDSLCSTSGSCASDEGDVCTTSANACGMTNAGTIACSGECSATTPSDDLCAASTGTCASDEGNACTTLANVCGMTNVGTVACSGACSAETPSDALCVPSTAPTTPAESGSSAQPSTPEAPPAATPSLSETVASVAAALEDIRALPEVQQAVSVAIPVATAAAATTAVVLASSFNLLSYLQFLVTSPFLIFARRKRKAFGIVYNAITKVAIDLATVRLYDVANNRLVRSAVTDAQGKYFFIANPGQYRITVTKHGFTFPSAYLHDVKDDGVFLDVYTGQAIEVSEKDATIAANIPLDPAEVGAQHTQKGIERTRMLRKLQFGLSFSGVVLSLGVWFFSPSIFTMALAVMQVVVFLFFWRLAQPRRPRGWGIVFDASNRRPVGNAVVRLFEPKYNKLVETTLTDTLGRYSFLVGPNEYFVRTDKDGYDQHIIRPIDYRQKTEPDAIAIDVPLTPTKPL